MSISLQYVAAFFHCIMPHEIIRAMNSFSLDLVVPVDAIFTRGSKVLN